jgi:hypothetical protein
MNMKNVFLFAALTAALLVTGACSSPDANANKTVNANVAAKPASTPAPAATANPNAETATEGAQDFTLVNKTGLVIDKVFISPHDSNDWEEDVLGQDQLADDATVDIKFQRNEKAALWDIKVEDTKGNAVMWTSLNLLTISKVTIRNEGGKATAEVE